MNENIKDSNKGEIIDLTEIIQKSSTEDEKIIDLNVVANDPFLETLELNQAVEKVEAKISIDEKSEEVFEDIDDELPHITLDEQSESQIKFNEIPVSTEQVEKIVERVIIKLFKEKIDNILIEVAENIVTKEMKKIKDLLAEQIDK